MSFSSEIKEELSKTNNLKNKEEVKYEFLGYLISSNIAIKKNKIGIINSSSIQTSSLIIPKCLTKIIAFSF